MEPIIKFDHQLFHFVNSSLGNPVFDFLMPLLRNKLIWIPLYIIIIYSFFKNFGKQGFYITLFLIACVGFADFTSASIIKKIVKRDRPCNEISYKKEVNSRVSCGTGYSFPSSHATDHFTIAVFIISLFKRKSNYILPAFLIWATLISFAQVYVGVHFPLDVISGGIYGSIIGFLFAKLFLYAFKSFDKHAVS